MDKSFVTKTRSKAITTTNKIWVLTIWLLGRLGYPGEIFSFHCKQKSPKSVCFPVFEHLPVCRLYLMRTVTTSHKNWLLWDKHIDQLSLQNTCGGSKHAAFFSIKSNKLSYCAKRGQRLRQTIRRKRNFEIPQYSGFLSTCACIRSYLSPTHYIHDPLHIISTRSFTYVHIIFMTKRCRNLRRPNKNFKFFCVDTRNCCHLWFF